MSEDKTQDISQRYDTKPTFETILKEVRSFRTSFEKRLDSWDARLRGVESRFDSVDSRLQGIEARFDSVDSRLRDVEARFDSRLDRIESEVKKTGSEFYELRADFRDFKKELREHFPIVK